MSSLKEIPRRSLIRKQKRWIWSKMGIRRIWNNLQTELLNSHFYDVSSVRAGVIILQNHLMVSYMFFVLYLDVKASIIGTSNNLGQNCRCRWWAKRWGASKEAQTLTRQPIFETCPWNAIHPTGQFRIDWSKSTWIKAFKRSSF